MRRISVTLLSVVLLTALAPSAAMAGPPVKPTDGIQSLVWVGLGPGSTDYCLTRIDVTHTVAKGPPRQLWAGVRDANDVDGTGTTRAAERDGGTSLQVSVWLGSTSSLTNPLRAWVLLQDKKWNTLTGRVYTNSWDFTSGCPASGTELGTYSAP